MNGHTFNEFVFVNRVKALLSIPRLSKNFIVQKEAVQNNLWMALDYSNLFVVVLRQHHRVLGTRSENATNYGQTHAF